MRSFAVFTATLLIGLAAWTPGNVLARESEAPGSCTFTIKGTFEGTEVNVTITVSDVSLIECALLKAGVKKAIK